MSLCGVFGWKELETTMYLLENNEVGNFVGNNKVFLHIISCRIKIRSPRQLQIFSHNPFHAPLTELT